MGRCVLVKNQPSQTHPGIYKDGKRELIYRVLWEARWGMDLEGYDLHHECGNPRCVNLDHLTLVTRRDHAHIHARERMRTHCKRGHSYEEHGRWRAGKGMDCKKCTNERKKQ